MSKRKAVRFVEDDEHGPKPKDSALLKRSAKRRPGDQTIGADSDGYDIAPGPSVGDETKSVKKYKSKHTLDSDEEEEDNAQQLNVDDVEGQEEATIEFDDETKITPFNMREEMEEGYYDAEENFVFKKDKQEIKDAWLDNIDWNTIKKEAGTLWHQNEDDEMDEPSIPVDRTEVYRGILLFMQPGETITKSLRRLGGNRNTNSARQQRWKEKKQKKNEQNVDSDAIVAVPSEEPPAVVDKNADDVIKLTEFVDKLVSEGEFEIYGYTYEKLKYEVEKRDNLKKFREGLSKKAEITNDDDELDMFADNIDSTHVEKPKTSLEATEVASSSKEEETKSQTAADSVTWEFKWSNDDNTDIHGPCSSEQMQKWVEDGYFKDGVFVRRCGQNDAKFYSSKRIDFDLYI